MIENYLTVQQLIDELQKVKDKRLPVSLYDGREVKQYILSNKTEFYEWHETVDGADTHLFEIAIGDCVVE